MTWLGQLASFLWTTAAVFFLISWFAAPVLLAYWKAREKRRAADTEDALKSLGFDHSHRWEQDAL